MDLNALNLFVSIVEAGNQSEAARKLNMTRSNISYRLKEFERSLGVQLIRRTTRNMELTEIGMGIYQHGLKILQEVAAAEALVSTAGKSFSGHVRLSVSAGLGLVILSDLLIEFKHAHPAISLDIVFSNQIYNLVGQHIDIAVRVISKPPESVQATLLANVEWVPCCHSDYLRANNARLHTLEDLKSHSIICSAAVGQKLKLKGRYQGGNRSVELEPNVRSENFYFLKQVVLGKLGIGFLPLYMIRAELETGDLVRVLKHYEMSIFGGRIYMLTTPTRFQTLATQVLVDFLKSRLTNEKIYGA